MVSVAKPMLIFGYHGFLFVLFFSKSMVNFRKRCVARLQKVMHLHLKKTHKMNIEIGF